MAYCTKCKKEMGALATECPYCKYRFPDEKIQEDSFRHVFVRHTIVALFLLSVFSYHVFSARYEFRNLSEVILGVLCAPIYLPFVFLLSTCTTFPYRFADGFMHPLSLVFFILFGLTGSYLYSVFILSIDKKLSSYSLAGKYLPSKSLIKFFFVCFLIVFAASFIKFNIKPKYYDNAMHRISCTNKLKQIGLSLRMYSNVYDDNFPLYDGAKGLNILVTKGFLENKLIYICPTVKFNNRFNEKRELGKTHLLTDYEYCGNLNEADPEDTPLAWDKELNHKNYRNVLFLDGHVRGVSDGEWKEKIAPKIIKRKFDLKPNTTHITY